MQEQRKLIQNGFSSIVNGELPSKRKETLIIYTNEHPKEYQGKNIRSQ